VYSGAGSRPFGSALTTFQRQGSAEQGLVPIGDVDGDGQMDAIMLETQPTQLVSYQSETSNYWTLRNEGVRPGLMFVTFGGPGLKTVQSPSPSFYREGPAASWMTPGDTWIGDPAGGRGDEVEGVRSVQNGRARETYYFDVAPVGAGDWDGDGYADVAFGMNGAPGPIALADEHWDTLSDPNHLRNYQVPTRDGETTTWFRFAAFADVRYGSSSGLGASPAQLILSPTTEATPALLPWVVFPRIDARTDGLFVGEGVLTTSILDRGPSFQPFAKTFFGPPGHLAPVR
jgi:hypothetical protein